MDAGAPRVDAGPGTLAIEDLFVGENPDNVLSYFVEWSTPVAASTGLHITCGDDFDEGYSDDALTTEHALFVMGLYPDARCSVSVRSVTEEGVEGVAEQPLVVAGLPGFLPDGLTVEVHDAAATEPGWTLANFHNHSQGGQLSVGLIDPQGRFRWYVRIGTNRFGTVVQEVAAHPEGVLVGSQGEIEPAFFGWDGQAIWSRPLPGSHHDVRRFPDADHLTYPTRGVGCGPIDAPAGGVDRMNLHTGEITWSWDICGRFDPPMWRSDWAHINTYEPIAEQSAFLLSLRNVSAVLKVDETSGDLIWHLGEGGDFTLESGEWFSLQHAVELQDDGHILLFDNGRAERGYSRAVELELDEVAMTARVVWEWIPEDTSGAWYTNIWGDADRLPNGNTLINFGQSSPDHPAHIIEVSPTGEPVWHLRFSTVWASYRADRVVAPPLIRATADLPSEL